MTRRIELQQYDCKWGDTFHLSPPPTMALRRRWQLCVNDRLLMLLLLLLQQCRHIPCQVRWLIVVFALIICVTIV